MEELGKKIASHRKQLGMTQSELGEKLSVTAQAVSKWENGLSDPDLATLQRLCKLFGVTVDELLGETDTEPQTSEEAPIAEEGTEVRILAGYCDSCKAPLYQGDTYHVHTYTRGGGQRILCAKCERQREIGAVRSELAEKKRAYRNGFIWGGSVGGAVALSFCIAAFATGDYALLGGLILAVGFFTFLSQCFWGEWMFEFFCVFLHTFRMPGLIFTLDIDGIIWAITVKFLLFVLGGMLSVIVALFGALLSMLISLFVFPFALIHIRREIAKKADLVKKMEANK